MKKRREIVSSARLYESTRAPPKKEANPASLRPLPLPREGARVDTPSFLWKEVPRRGGDWMGRSGVKKSEEMCLKSTIYESTLSTAARSPFPKGKGCDTRALLSPYRQSEYMHVWKNNTDEQSLPRVGKVASGASRIGFWRDEKERGDRLKCVVYESTRAPPQKEANPASLRSAAPSKGRGSRGHSLLPMEGGAPKGRRLDGGSGMKESEEMHLKSTINESTLSTATRSPFPNGEGCDTRMPLFSHRQSEYRIRREKE